MDAVKAVLSEAEEWMWDDHNLTEYRAKVASLRADIKVRTAHPSDCDRAPSDCDSSSSIQPSMQPSTQPTSR